MDLKDLEEDLARVIGRVKELVAELPADSLTRADLECVLADRLRPAEAEVRRMAVVQGGRLQ